MSCSIDDDDDDDDYDYKWRRDYDNYYHTIFKHITERN